MELDTPSQAYFRCDRWFVSVNCSLIRDGESCSSFWSVVKGEGRADETGQKRQEGRGPQYQGGALWPLKWEFIVHFFISISPITFLSFLDAWRRFYGNMRPNIAKLEKFDIKKPRIRHRNHQSFRHFPRDFYQNSSKFPFFRLRFCNKN